jgi:hypothetical protein
MKSPRWDKAPRQSQYFLSWWKFEVFEKHAVRNGISSVYRQSRLHRRVPRSGWDGNLALVFTRGRLAAKRRRAIEIGRDIDSSVYRRREFWSPLVLVIRLIVRNDAPREVAPACSFQEEVTLVSKDERVRRDS